MKRFTQFVVIIALSLFIFAKPATPVFAWPAGETFGLDTDTGVLRDQMNDGVYTWHESNYFDIANACKIYPIKGPQWCTNDPNRFQAMLKKSALGNIASAMGTIYDNPSASLAYWIRDTGQSLGFIPRQAYAQGIGFNGLRAFLPIWKAFRNIAYVILALAMVVVGFMVMMRKRIDPKTVVTVQNALPRIVITLILITFSYAIAGFFIDLMYLAIAFIHLIVQANLPEPPQLIQILRINYVSGGFGDLFGSIFGALNRWNPASQVIGDALNRNWPEFWRDAVGGLITNGFLVGPLFMLLLLLAYLFAFVRILFMLIGNYIQILLAVLTAPIQILADVFPGSNAFTEWIKNIVANLVAFPITIFFLMLANAISFQFGGQTLWTPPLLPQPVLQTGVGDLGGMGGLAETIIAVGIIMTIPNVVNGIKERFKTQPLVTPSVNVGGALGTGSQILSAMFYMKELRRKPQNVIVQEEQPQHKS